MINMRAHHLCFDRDTPLALEGNEGLKRHCSSRVEMQNTLLKCLLENPGVHCRDVESVLTKIHKMKLDGHQRLQVSPSQSAELHF